MLRRSMLERELELLDGAGIRPVVLRPSAADRAAMGSDPMSTAGARDAVRAGRERAEGFRKVGARPSAT